MNQTKTRLCTCQKYCHAPPQGKAIPQRTWYNHAAQRALEADMTLQERESQQVRRKRRRMRSQEEDMHGAGRSSGEQARNIASDNSANASSHVNTNDGLYSNTPPPLTLFDGELVQDSAGEEGVSTDTDVPLATLGCLASVQKLIMQLQSVTFNAEEEWSAEKFGALLTTPCGLDDTELRFSLRIYLVLAAHYSKATYEAVRTSIKTRWPDSMMLSFDQVRNWLIAFADELKLLVVRGKYGLTGFVKFLEDLVRDRSVDEDLLDGKFTPLSSTPTPRALHAPMLSVNNPSGSTSSDNLPTSASADNASASTNNASASADNASASADNASASALTIKVKMGQKGNGRGSWKPPSTLLPKWECAREWKEQNTEGTQREFEKYWEEVSQDKQTVQVYRDKVKIAKGKATS